MKKISGGYIYTVPVGLTLHCAACPKGEGVLEAGDECFVEDADSSSVYCLRHIPRPRVGVLERVEKAYRPRRAHRRREWEVVYE